MGALGLPYSWGNVALCALQAVLVALPAAGIPAALERLRGRAWALVLPGSIALCVAGLALAPGAADGLTWLALVALPPLAVLALAWASHGARWWLGAAAVAAFAICLATQGTDAAAWTGSALTALSCVTLGRLLAAGAPTPLLRVALVVMAIIDAALVFSSGIDQPTAVLNAASPGPGLPQLQTVGIGGATMGYGDVFVAGVLGGVLAAEGRRQWLPALAVLVASLLFDLLFSVRDLLPATVPVAAVTVAFGGLSLSRLPTSWTRWWPGARRSRLPAR